MKTKFNYNSKQKKQLSKLALKGLKNKIDLLPDVSSMYQKKLDKKRKLQKYINILNEEVDILKTIKFDGYLIMLSDIINYAKQLNISITCYGSVQNSLISYLLDIVDDYTIKNKKNFIPFEKKPTLYIVADFSRYYEDVLINRILTARDEDNHKSFSSIDDLKRRVPIINDTDIKTIKENRS